MRSLAAIALLVGLTVATSVIGDEKHIVRDRRNAVDEYYNKGSNLRGKEVRREGLLRDEDVATYRVDVDEREINEIIGDFKEFGGKYVAKTEKERNALLRKLKEAFRNTAAKMILNFGKLIPPVVQSWASVMKHIQVDEKCDQDCAVKCLDPKAGCESLYFDKKCLSSCRCQFDIEELDPELIRTRMDNITKNVDVVHKYFKNQRAENMKLVKPTFDNYLSKAAGLHEEFGELLREHAAKVFGCDENCLDDCLDPSFISFWEIPSCVKHCKCEYGLVRIEREDEHRGVSFMSRDFEEEDRERIEEEREEEEEEFLRNPVSHHHRERRHRNQECRDRKNLDLPNLMKYSDYDRKAWNFFKRYTDEI